MKGLDWTPSDVRMKVGDRLTITANFPVKRKWWQFWKPRWVSGPRETREHVIVATATSKAGEREDLAPWIRRLDDSQAMANQCQAVANEWQSTA